MSAGTYFAISSFRSAYTLCSDRASDCCVDSSRERHFIEAFSRQQKPLTAMSWQVALGTRNLQFCLTCNCGFLGSEDPWNDQQRGWWRLTSASGWLNWHLHPRQLAQHIAFAHLLKH